MTNLSHEYVFKNLLSINYDPSFYKPYDDILGRCLPHYILRELESEPSPSKKMRKDSKKFCIFKGVMYSTVGSVICDSKQEVFLQNILNILNDKLNEENEEKYVMSVFYAIALFQLSEDINIMADSKDEIVRPTIGYWLDDIVKYFDHHDRWSLIAKKMIAEQRQHLASFAKAMVHVLVYIHLNNKGENYDELMRNSKFTYPQIGMILLCEIAGLYNMERWLNNSSYYSNYRCGGILPFSKMFVPIEQKKSKKKRHWENCGDSSLEAPPYVIENINDQIIAEDEDINGYILLRVLNGDMLKRWALSCMMTISYIIASGRYTVWKERYIKEPVLDAQLVVDESYGFVCVQIRGKQVDLTDLKNAADLGDEEIEVGFHFIALTMALYKRMLLYLNPDYHLTMSDNNSYFMFISRENNEHSKLFFYAHQPELRNVDEQDAEVCEQQKWDRVNEINDDISKFIIWKKWYASHNGSEYIIDEMGGLFHLNYFLNDQEVITAGAKFIAKMIGDECKNLENPFIKYEQTDEESMDAFECWLEEYKDYVRYNNKNI